MILRRDPDQLYRSPLLETEPWLDHAFGTAAAMPAPGFLTLKQVHSARVIPSNEWNEELEGDALITATPGLRLAVKSADCVPILLADPDRRAVAAVHAGWRGTLADIAGEAVRALAVRFGSLPSRLIAALGPSIGPCCFQVGPEVGVLFREIFPEWDPDLVPPTIDLREANRRLLARAGVHPRRIQTAAPCSCCTGPEFHSWRRDRQKGQRMFAVIGIRE